ncbi:hypothetical protein RCCS2_12959 [Roseobacter sp. CCS2]|nr:hypothetical protein RCCS2_12959 [Roseobacter sp. CCS2]
MVSPHDALQAATEGEVFNSQGQFTVDRLSCKTNGTSRRPRAVMKRSEIFRKFQENLQDFQGTQKLTLGHCLAERVMIQTMTSSSQIVQDPQSDCNDERRDHH